MQFTPVFVIAVVIIVQNSNMYYNALFKIIFTDSPYLLIPKSNYKQIN